MKAHQIVFNRLALTVTISLVVLGTTLAGEAQASCFANRNPLASARVQFAPTTAVRSSEANDQSTGSIVGLWNAEFLIGDGPDVYDQSFQQFHSDNTEMMLSRGLPPSLGNVCVGIWKQTGPRTYRLKHMAWNWNGDGSFAGTFNMEVTLRLSRSGTGYAGTWSADSFDTSGALIPELHAEGVARATRITAD